MTQKLYAERDIIEQGDYYFRHASAMTGEGLHSKSDIAAELAHRDIQIDRLREQLEQAEAVEEFAAYLDSAGNVVERNRAEDYAQRLRSQADEMEKGGSHE